MRRIGRNRRRGFTVLEMLVVIAILLILMAALVSLFGSVGGRVKTDATERQVHMIGCKLDEAVRLDGRLPAALIDMEPRISVRRWVRDGRFVDAWDRPLQYVPNGRSFRLWSAGPDGVSGTPDDIGYVD